mmetsp:Transcript_1785/g.6884  ORF Transcript_1785/g.6884 Transcript_1785/m.6884 type:complete len:218 (+) Transcript_1785:55-708(+)
MSPCRPHGAWMDVVRRTPERVLSLPRRHEVVGSRCVRSSSGTPRRRVVPSCLEEAQVGQRGRDACHSDEGDAEEERERGEAAEDGSEEDERGGEEDHECGGAARRGEPRLARVARHGRCRRRPEDRDRGGRRGAQQRTPRRRRRVLVVGDRRTTMAVDDDDWRRLKVGATVFEEPFRRGTPTAADGGAVAEGDARDSFREEVEAVGEPVGRALDDVH